jgi:hypothetical protein
MHTRRVFYTCSKLDRYEYGYKCLPVDTCTYMRFHLQPLCYRADICSTQSDPDPLPSLAESGSFHGVTPHQWSLVISRESITYGCLLVVMTSSMQWWWQVVMGWQQFGLARYWISPAQCLKGIFSFKIV